MKMNTQELQNLKMHLHVRSNFLQTLHYLDIKKFFNSKAMKIVKNIVGKVGNFHLKSDRFKLVRIYKNVYIFSNFIDRFSLLNWLICKMLYEEFHIITNSFETLADRAENLHTRSGCQKNKVPKISAP